MCLTYILYGISCLANVTYGMPYEMRNRALQNTYDFSGFMFSGYGCVSTGGCLVSETLDGAKQVLTATFRDPITQTLLIHSSLTRTQFETVLISMLGQELSGRPVLSHERLVLRLTKPKLTRGSFNRTLSQARRNIVGSIYTILLLGYVGLFDSPELAPFLELASRMKAYIDQREASETMTQEDRGEVMKIIGDELEEAINTLVRGAPNEV